MQVGDEVTWIHTRKLKYGHQFSTRKGKVIKADGDALYVKFRSEIIELHRSEVNKYVEGGLI